MPCVPNAMKGHKSSESNQVVLRSVWCFFVTSKKIKKVAQNLI
jgi:hypothetical protein